MVTLFYIFVFLAIWHFFYESVLASSLRHGLRYNFFSLRDQLRNIKIDNSLNKKDEQIYEILDGAICDMINSMSFISVGNYFKLKKDIKINSDIENVKAFIETADNENLKKIDEEIGLLGGRALVINNGGWTIYLIAPILVIILVAIFNAQLDRVTKLITKISTRLIYSSDNNNIRIA